MNYTSLADELARVTHQLQELHAKMRDHESPDSSAKAGNNLGFDLTLEAARIFPPILDYKKFTITNTQSVTVQINGHDDEMVLALNGKSIYWSRDHGAPARTEIIEPAQMASDLNVITVYVGNLFRRDNPASLSGFIRAGDNTPHPINHNRIQFEGIFFLGAYAILRTA